MQGNAVQADNPPFRQKGPYFKCGKEGHFARECQSSRVNYINYINQGEDMLMVQDTLTLENFLDNALKMFDTLPLNQKDTFI